MEAKLKQIQKLRQALEDGYRTKGTGERILLSDAVRKDYELKIRAFEAKRGKYCYLSAVIHTPKGGTPQKVVYGPARRYMDEKNRPKYCSRKKFFERLRSGELTIQQDLAIAA